MQDKDKSNSQNHPGILGIEVSRAFAEADGCPVCHLIHEFALSYSRSILHEYVNSPAFVGPFLQSVGLCPEHWDMFLSQGDLLGNSLLANAMISQALAYVDESIKRASAVRSGVRKRPGSGRLFPWTTHLRPCHLCELESDAEKRYAWAVSEMMTHREIDPRQAGESLCLRHAVMVACEAPPETASEMLSACREKLVCLKEGCRQITDSFDYRYKGDKPDESALYEAVKKVSLPGPGGQQHLARRPGNAIFDRLHNRF